MFLEGFVLFNFFLNLDFHVISGIEIQDLQTVFAVHNFEERKRWKDHLPIRRRVLSHTKYLCTSCVQQWVWLALKENNEFLTDAGGGFTKEKCNMVTGLLRMINTRSDQSSLFVVHRISLNAYLWLGKSISICKLFNFNYI